MTFDEAVNKVQTAVVMQRLEAEPGARGQALVSVRDLCVALEALGLMKYSDEAQDKIDYDARLALARCMTEIKTGPCDASVDTCGRITGYGAGVIVAALRANGFRLVRS